MNKIPHLTIFKLSRGWKVELSFTAPVQPSPESLASDRAGLCWIFITKLKNHMKTAMGFFFMCAKWAETFREDLWALRPPRRRFIILLVRTRSWVRLWSSDRVLLSKLGLFKWLKGVLNGLDRSQTKCWCKSCKVNLPPPGVTCRLIVFYFISCNVSNLSVQQAAFVWQHGSISDFLSTRLEKSTIFWLCPAKRLMLQLLSSFITKFRNWISFKTRCPQIPGWFIFAAPYVTLKRVPQVWLGHPLNFLSLSPRQL